MITYDYKPKGVCSKMIHIGLSDDGSTIEHVDFEGGCNGNLKAVSKLITGHPVDEISSLLAGNTCGPRKTSCADQLSRGLREAAALAPTGSGSAAPAMGDQSEACPVSSAR